MRVVKRINNNVALGLDGNRQEVILVGKGIGFGSLPYELTDLSKIERTYYDIDQKYYGLLKEIPEDIFSLVTKMVDVARAKIPENLNPNLVFTLADHINFAVMRNRKGMNLALPYSYEMEYEYPQLTRIARWMVKNVNERCGTALHKGEVTSITMHLLNALEGEKTGAADADGMNMDISDRTAKVIATSVKIIEEYFSIQLDKNSFNYFRFKNHMKFFVQRKEQNEEFYDGNHELYENVKQAYPQISECVSRIDDYILKEFHRRCTEDELLYLIVHINRLYTKEDCNRKGITSEKQ